MASIFYITSIILVLLVKINNSSLVFLLSYYILKYINLLELRLNNFLKCLNFYYYIVKVDIITFFI